jgi:hypothetical protein
VYWRAFGKEEVLVTASRQPCYYYLDNMFFERDFGGAAVDCANKAVKVSRYAERFTLRFLDWRYIEGLNYA